MAKSPLRRAKRDDLHWIQIGRCFWCDEPVPQELATLDELHARAKGGTAKWGNIVMSCYGCNHSRGSTKAPEWAYREAKRLAVIRQAAHMANRIVGGQAVLITMA